MSAFVSVKSECSVWSLMVDDVLSFGCLVLYGDMPAHNFLWRECSKSSGDVATRLAVIPLVQEARGLDAGPRLVQKLVGFGDHTTSNIVAKIADEEIAHVAVGEFWFALVCQKTDRTPSDAFKGLKPLFLWSRRAPNLDRHYLVRTKQIGEEVSWEKIVYGDRKRSELAVRSQ
ncbi:hypothetical protein KSP40_PGU021201 [Platanthera guangdongensis]|uniref:Uncharacterized protein n=1 Tax=Platanthera guangdongensis TaxID=2320717 RepID=A0ABR2M4E7_9ASPA